VSPGSEPVGLRPMTAADSRAAAALVTRTLEHSYASIGRPSVSPGPSPADDRLGRAIARLTSTDPGGCWVVERLGELVAVAVAIRRESLWGLALLFVEPSAQDAGLGRALLARTLAYGHGCATKVILASEDPRAIRAYARLGLPLYPAVRAAGTPREVLGALASEVRSGDRSDLGLVEDVDQALRGSSRAEDVAFLLQDGASMLVGTDGQDRGYVLYRSGDGVIDGQPILLGADGDGVARDLLREVLATAAGPIKLHGLTQCQRWAIDVAIEAGLDVLPGGPLFMSSPRQPPKSWLPSGVYF